MNNEYQTKMELVNARQFGRYLIYEEDIETAISEHCTTRTHRDDN